MKSKTTEKPTKTALLVAGIGLAIVIIWLLLP